MAFLHSQDLMCLPGSSLHFASEDDATSDEQSNGEKDQQPKEVMGVIISQVDFPVVVPHPIQAKHYCEYEDGGAWDTMDPHVVAPIDFQVAIAQYLDEAEDGPSSPQKPPMDLCYWEWVSDSNGVSKDYVTLITHT